MNGIEIQFLLGIFFFVTGLADLAVTTSDNRPGLVEFLAGVILIFLALIRFSPVS